jgi:hypothetical protein
MFHAELKGSERGQEGTAKAGLSALLDRVASEAKDSLSLDPKKAIRHPDPTRILLSV